VHSLQTQEFSAAWKLLIVLDATDRNAALLRDAFLSIAVFSPPYDEMLKAAGVPTAKPTGERSELSEKYDQGKRLYLDYVSHKWSDTSPPSDEEGDKWPTDRAFIRRFVQRRADELRQRDDAQLSQIATWLRDAPQEPQRVLPLIAKLIASSHSDVQTCITILSEESGRSKRPTGFSLFGNRCR
jgi:hypothetical protein